MRIDFSAWGPVQSNELVHEVLAGLLRVLRVTLEVGETKLCNRAVCDLGLEEIHLVEEENEGGVLKPMRICD